MKRIIVLALAACMVLGAALSASAAEISASGSLYMGYNYLNKDDAGDTNKFNQRFRSQINIVSSENLSGVVYFEIDQDWGRTKDGNVGGTSGGRIGADGVNVETKRAYVDFLVPSTTIRLRGGIQGLSLPGAVAGSPILTDDVAAIVATSAISNVNVTGFFARPYDTSSSQTTVDLFGAVLAADLGPATVSPYFMYANVGDNATITGGSHDYTTGNIDDNVTWVGVAVEVAPINNLSFDFDGIYGKVNGKDAGYFFAGKAAYAMDFFVPAVVAWYGSGADNNDGEGILPSLGTGGFAPTTLVGWGGAATSADDILGPGQGKWGVSLQATEMTFIEKLTHTARVSYIRGTNDNDVTASLDTWGEDDAAFEFDFVSTYAVYENLDFIVDLAYVTTDFDSNEIEDIDNVFKAAAGVKYNF